MYARVNTFEGTVERFEEAEEFLREVVIPASRLAPGFAGMLSLIDRDTGRSLGITLWETREALDSSEAAAAMIRGRTTSTPEVRLVSVERFEVADLVLETRAL